MNTVSLLFYGLNERELHRLLSAAESGLEVDSRPTLPASLGDAIAIVGVVLSAAQLALTLHQIKAAKKDSLQGMNVRVEIERPDGTTIRLEGENVQEIQAYLE